MHDVVALFEDLPGTDFDTGRPLILRRGQTGTVVMTHDAPLGDRFAWRGHERDSGRCWIARGHHGGHRPSTRESLDLREEIAQWERTAREDRFEREVALRAFAIFGGSRGGPVGDRAAGERLWDTIKDEMPGGRCPQRQ